MARQSTLTHNTSAMKGFYTQLATIAGPILIQSLLTSSLSFVDTLMIGQLGDVQIAAVGLANQMFFLIILFFFGVSSGSAVFIAQFWGNDDIRSIHKTMGIGLALSLAGAVILSGISILLPQTVMRVFSPDSAVIETGSVYLRIVGVSYIFSAVSIIFSASLRSTEQAQIPLIATVFSLAVNIVLNYILIFGKLGLPAMGVAGAALATTIARALEMIIIIIITYSGQKAVAGKLSDLFSFSRPFVQKFFKTALPVILNEVVWSLGMVAYKMVYARMGTPVIASANIVESIQSLFFVIFIGTANGGAVMIGKKIGERQYETARLYAKRFCSLALILGTVIGIIMFFGAPFIPRAFRASEEIIRLSSRSLMLLALVLPIKAFNLHSIVGILRSGGDTRTSLLLELTSVWFVGVPLAFFGGLVLHLPIYYLYLLISLEEIYKMVLSLLRIRSARWIHDLTEVPEVPQIIGVSGAEIP